MKKFICISCLLLIISLSVNAQIIMNWNKKVSIGAETEEFDPLLMVGDNWYFEETDDTSTGIGGAPCVLNGNNIGVYGRFETISSNSPYGNYGVSGISTVNFNHGRNYGLFAMIEPTNSSVGGAGIYATDCDYYYTYPHNIQGTYAAYFVGNVHAYGNLTVPCLFTTMDNKLIDNTVSLSKSKRSGKTTLENLLNMNVVEYNLKSRRLEEIPENVTPEKAEELRKELEFLKKEDKEMTSRRHFGVDARALQKVYPDLVLEGQDGYLSVNYLEMVPLVIRSIQELKQELDELADDEEGKE